MTKFCVLLLVNSLICVGLYYVTQKGMLLYPIRRIFERKGDNGVYYVCEWLYKPLVGCLTCMASIHGVYVFLWYVEPESIDLLLYLIPYCLALAGLNTVFFSITERM